MKVHILLIGLILLPKLIVGQGIVCIRPDSTIQDTLHPKKFVRFSLITPIKTYWGQVIQLKADSVQFKIGDIPYGSTTNWIAINQLAGLRKSNVLSSPIARYAYNYVFIVEGVRLPRYAFANYAEWSKFEQISINLLSGLVIGGAFYFLSNKIIWPKQLRQRTQNGWRFKIAYK